MQRNLEKKDLAISLRKKGKSIRDIERELSIARSTLSGWLRDVKLSQKQKEKLHKKWMQALVNARLKSAEHNRRAKIERMKKIENDAKNFVSSITIDKEIEEIIYAIFYLAEGTKIPQAGRVEIANTNPDVMLAFLSLFRRLYSPDESRIKCQLHLRVDQSEKKIKNYWSKVLSIPKCRFIKTQFDKRALKPSFKNYKGVCVVYYCDTNMHKKIVTIGEEILLKIINNSKGARSSVG